MNKDLLCDHEMPAPVHDGSGTTPDTTPGSTPTNSLSSKGRVRRTSSSKSLRSPKAPQGTLAEEHLAQGHVEQGQVQVAQVGRALAGRTHAEDVLRKAARIAQLESLLREERKVKQQEVREGSMRICNIT